jgi:RNA-binding motif X-linked protein 2|tara:strand:- start:260 stop:901 length:642 start_codon:yes stop_codon:yes gene_type:complete
MNRVQEINRINELELSKGIAGAASWHWQYRNSAWIFVGGLVVKLTEGDVLCVFSQWGEIDDIHLARDATSGRSKGFAFIRYVDARSCVLAVDNMNGIEICNRTISVDHKLEYAAPKRKREELAKLDAAELAPKEWKAGHAYEGKELRSAFSIDTGFDVFGSTDGEGGGAKARKKAEKKQRKEARAEKRERKQAKKQDKKRAKKAKKERRAAGR